MAHIFGEISNRNLVEMEQERPLCILCCDQVFRRHVHKHAHMTLAMSDAYFFGFSNHSLDPFDIFLPISNFQTTTCLPSLHLKIYIYIHTYMYNITICILDHTGLDVFPTFGSSQPLGCRWPLQWRSLAPLGETLSNATPEERSGDRGRSAREDRAGAMGGRLEGSCVELLMITKHNLKGIIP